MGGGSYSEKSRSVRAVDEGYHTKPVQEVFKSRSLDNDMDPKGVVRRESRDSDEHPNSVAIILALDVTGSMYRIPHDLVKDGLPKMMSNIIERGVADPQLLFLAVGDHKSDDAPLQVSQFESSDELLDKWLTTVWLEGNGGGNGGESYFLPWYFAAKHTETDDWEKRGNKGFLFTIGDEPTHQHISADSLKEIMGGGEHKDWNIEELYAAACERYNVFHLHVKEGSNGSRQDVMNGWKDLIGDNLIIVDDFRDVPKLIADKIIGDYNGKAIKSPVVETTEEVKEEQSTESSSDKEEML